MIFTEILQISIAIIIKTDCYTTAKIVEEHRQLPALAATFLKNG